MLSAVEQCIHPLEEEGGVVLFKDGTYLFVRVKNIYEGTPTAKGLYETDQEELIANVLSKVGEGWKLFASFHTHPTFSATPSQLDVSALFRGFKYNIIYSPVRGEFSYSIWENDALRCSILSINHVKSAANV